MEYLDLTGEITPGQHRAVYESLLEQFENWRRERRWCVELYTAHVSRLSRVFRWDYSDNGRYSGHGGSVIDVWLDFSVVMDCAQDLRHLRGRVLAFTREMPDYCDLERANRFLTTAGLPPWAEEPAEGPKRYEVSLYCTATTGLTEAEITAKLTRLARAVGAPARSVSIAVREDRPSRTGYIPESATTALLRAA